MSESVETRCLPDRPPIDPNLYRAARIEETITIDGRFFACVQHPQKPRVLIWREYPDPKTHEDELGWVMVQVDRAAKRGVTLLYGAWWLARVSPHDDAPQDASHDGVYEIASDGSDKGTSVLVHTDGSDGHGTT
jgi:hypothetical protein